MERGALGKTISAGMAVCLSICAQGFAQTNAGAQLKEPPPPRRLWSIASASGPVRVDGVLDEPAWQSATRVPMEYEWYPGDNTPTPQRTDCLVMYDHDNFYVAFKAYDPDPRQIRAQLADRDTPFNDDTVGFMIDPFDDGRRAFQFRVNALGVQMDATNSDIDQSEDWAWDTIWESRGRIDDAGYVVEIAIPFSSLRFPRRDPQTWGFVAMRDYPRSLRHRMRSTWWDRNRTCLVCQFDALTGFRGITPGLNLELDPTFTTARTDERQDLEGSLARGELKPQAGVSVRWSITPNLIANATLNPDFYQVEADAAQLDVNTRFALFYEEKRPFFLEGADFFRTPIQAVFTRTIADPTWGTKITGKEDRNAFGVFVARDEINNLIFPANESSSQDSIEQPVTTGVARLRRDIGQTSSVGVLYTGRSGAAYHNHVGGLDGLFRFTRSDSIEYQVLASDTAYPDDTAERHAQPLGSFAGGAASVNYLHGTRTWNWQASGSVLSPQFRADAGFVTRTNVREGLAAVSRSFWGRPGQWFSRIDLNGTADVVYDDAGRLTDRAVDFPVQYEGARQLQLTYVPMFARETFGGVSYDNVRHYVSVSMRPTGSIAFFMNGKAGGTIDFANARPATTRQIVPSVEFVLAQRTTGSLKHTYERLAVDGGRLFTANLTQARVVYHLNLRTFLRAILQYTDVNRNESLYLSPVPSRSRRLFSQYLFSYKLNPQTVVLVGYSDIHEGLREVDLTQTNRTVFVKLGYAIVR